MFTYNNNNNASENHGQQLLPLTRMFSQDYYQKNKSTDADV